jgi:hypothetical protein
MKQLNRLVKHDLVRGLKDVVFVKDKLCSSCQVGKQVGNIHHKKSIMSTSKAFELLHMDLFGPTQYTSIGGNKYGFVTVDDYTRYTWTFFLVDKSDVFLIFKSFIKGIHNEFETTIKRVRSAMVMSSRTQELMSFVLILELDINSWPSTLHNQMTLLRGRIEHLLTCQSLCLVSTM